MTQTSFNTPVLLVLFSRTDTAAKVLDEIRKVRAPKLYIFADAPRKDRPQEIKDCEAARKLVETIDWPCEIKTNFQAENLGTRYAIGTAVNWLFEHEDCGIVFEHDCLPGNSFFFFCQELLEKHKDDERIMHIGGDNFQFGHKPFDFSYYYSRYNHIWGWATWKRAWKHYDVEMARYPYFKERGLLQNIISEPRIRDFWINIFDQVYEKKLLTWDYQWTLAMWMNNGLAILPTQNLVSNIGFGDGAINTTNSESVLANIPRHELLEIKHNDIVMPDNDADNWSINHVFHPPLSRLAIRKLKRLLGIKYKL